MPTRHDRYGGPGLDGSPNAVEGNHFEDSFSDYSEMLGEDTSKVLSGIDVNNLDTSILSSIDTESLGLSSFIENLDGETISDVVVDGGSGIFDYISDIFEMLF